MVFPEFSTVATANVKQDKTAFSAQALNPIGKLSTVQFTSFFPPSCIPDTTIALCKHPRYVRFAKKNQSAE